MIYLIEIEAYDPVSAAVVTLRYASSGYNTSPADDPPNEHFEERVIQPGNYERSAFATGRTTGEASVGYGEIVLANADGALDDLIAYGFDGRTLRIIGLADEFAPWSARSTIFVGTMEQAEFSWTRVTIRLRDRLEELREAIQTETYAGTTIAGGMSEAEGTEDDLKGKMKPLLFGVGQNIPAVLASRFDLVIQVSSRPLDAIPAVRDNGVPLAATSDYPDLVALLAATISPGQYATCLARGSYRLGGAPVGVITCDAVEGGDGERSAANTVARILTGAGFTVGTDYLQADVDALHAANPAEVGIWIEPSEIDILAVCMALLNSIGGTIVPDRLGVFRMSRIEQPAGEPVVVLDEDIVLDRGAGIERIATNDEGSGVPAAKVTVHYGRAWLVQADLEGTAASEAVKAFASEAFRTAVAEDASVRTAHLLASEPSFDTLLISAADVQAEAERRLAIYSVRRDRFRVPVKADQIPEVDLGSVVALRVDRFGLQAGKLFLVLGIEENFETGVTTLDIWG